LRVGGAGTDGETRKNGSPEQRVVGGMAEFGNDIATLVELQYKLAMADLKDSLQQALLPMVLIVLGLLLVVGAVPIMLFGVAELVAVALKIGIGWALLLTGGLTAVLTGTVLIFLASRIPKSFSSFRRSREEFARNLAWIRTVLLYSGRNVPRRYR